MEPLLKPEEIIMARKNGLNRKEQVLCAKWLKEGISAQDIAKKFSTSAEIVNKFTQGKLDAAAAKAKDRMETQNKATAQMKKKAAVLNETLEQAKKDADFV